MATTIPYDQRPGYRLKQAEHALRLATDDALALMGLTTPQYAALSALEAGRGAANVDLAHRCFVTPQTMHRIVRQLLDKSLVSSTGGGRGRAHRLELTDAGSHVLRRAHQAVLAIEERMTGGEDTQPIVAALGRYSGRLDRD